MGGREHVWPEHQKVPVRSKFRSLKKKFELKQKQTGIHSMVTYFLVYLIHLYSINQLSHELTKSCCLYQGMHGM